MRQKQILKNLKEALKQDYLYTSEELSFMREQLDVLEKETRLVNDQFLIKNQSF